MAESPATGLTVVIPHYGSPRPALSLVRALQADPTRRALQIVVVDDCSPEPFAQIDGVDVVRRDRNGGYGSAVNSGVQKADQPLLLVLNSDLALPGGFLDEFVEAAVPLMPAVVAPTVFTGGREEPIGRRRPRARFQAVEWTSALGRWQHTPLFERLIGQVAGPPLGRTREVDWVAGVALLLPTFEFRAVGGFDESFFMYAEEVDLQRRLRDRGVPAIQIGTRPVVHVGGSSSDPERSREWLTRSRLRYAAKWGGHSRLRAALSAATVVNLGVNGIRRAAGRPVSPLSTARREWGLIWKRW